MRNVADAAGVSPKTVSRVINLEPGVHEKTSARVAAAIAALGYRRNDGARNLRKGIRLSTIGLVIEDLANPFYAAVARAVEEVAQRNGYGMILTSSTEDPDREPRLVRDLLERGVEGLLIMPAGRDHRYLERALPFGIRVVFLDRPPGGIDVDAVLLDNIGGARRGVEHLIGHGHRRIAFVGDPATVWTAGERLTGYRQALIDAGLPIDDELIRMGPPRVEAAEAATRRMLAVVDPPTAIFAQNNRNCVGVLRALHRAHARIAVVGFDDFELADMLPDPVTVVAYDPGELGRMAAELLFARIAGDSREAQRILVPTRLIARGSGEMVPVQARTDG
jgi:LacI family transcriptional regulator, galactose operon repressor